MLTQFIKDNFKKRYVINLDRRPDRYQEFCERVPFDYKIVERLSAVDGQNIKCEKKHENPFVIGCHLSHKKIIECIINDESLNDNDLFIYFEDDVFFTKEFENTFIRSVEYLKNIKNSNYILNIGGRFEPSYDKRDSKLWKLVTNNLYIKESSIQYNSKEIERTTHCIIMTKSSAKIFYNHINNKEHIPIDCLYNSICKNNNLITRYETFPHICYSPLKYKSDIK